MIPIIEIVEVLRSCLARKKYCSVFTDLTQGVSIFTGIQPLPHTTTNSRTHLCSNPQNSQSACSIIQTWGVDLNIYISYKYRMCLSSISKMLFQKKKLTFVKFVYRVAIKIIGSATELASLARAWQHSIDIHLCADTAMLSYHFFLNKPRSRKSLEYGNVMIQLVLSLGQILQYFSWFVCTVSW